MAINKLLLCLFKMTLRSSFRQLNMQNIFTPARSIEGLLSERFKSLGCLTAQTTNLHTTSRNNDLNEFFDDKENWTKSTVRVGRPWKKEELRIKSNVDLHKLWYVLLKERNMLLTMEAEYKRICHLMPSPERFEKVEESMENLLEVIAERNRAYNMLESGETGEPRRVPSYNVLGLPYMRPEREHFEPLYASPRRKMYDRWQKTWQIPYLRLWREKKLKREKTAKIVRRKNEQKLRELFPNYAAKAAEQES